MDDGGCIPVRYKDRGDVLSEELTEPLEPYWPIGNAIKQEPGSNLPTYGRQFYDLIWSLALVNAFIEHGP